MDFICDANACMGLYLHGLHFNNIRKQMRHIIFVSFFILFAIKCESIRDKIPLSPAFLFAAYLLFNFKQNAK